MKLLDKKKEQIEQAWVKKVFAMLFERFLRMVVKVEVAQDEAAAGKFDSIIITQKDGRIWHYNMPVGVYTEAELKIVFDSILEKII